MISDYLFKGIDNIFAQKLGHGAKLKTGKKLNREIIKANLDCVVK
jgi:hypothetical protein